MMKVRCIANTGNRLLQTTLNYSGDSFETKYPIKIGEIHIVYGQCISKGILKYLIVGTYENLPSWYPAELFEVCNSILPLEWYFQYDANCVISAIWGYKELVLDESHYDGLIDREDIAIRVFLKRKREIDENN
jgi:hypothetical protein